jgi:hypothetical protein
MFLREADMYGFRLEVDCCHLDWRVSSVAQISNSLNQLFSMVEDLTLGHEAHDQSSEEHNDVDRIQWRNHLTSRSFKKREDPSRRGWARRKTLSLSTIRRRRAPFGAVPELQVLTYSGSRDFLGAFTSFIDARQNTGRPVALFPRNLGHALSLRQSRLSTITSLDDESGNDIET